jgi:hypothetical protein
MLQSIRPAKKDQVFDLVEEAGFDVSDWIASSNDARGYKANPKYCYEWSFVEPGRVVILNLWFDQMREEDGLVVQRNNFRQDAAANAGKPIWARRATKLDESLQQALRDNLPVRVIVNDGARRRQRDPDAHASRVTARELDSELWTITQYDWATGTHAITRGVLAQPFIDQFDMNQADKGWPERRTGSVSSFVRDPEVRRKVLRRASGRCEHCGALGFRMSSGSIYLETHHVVPLCEGGADNVRNVAALCPNDHRKAHFSNDRDTMRASLLAKLNWSPRTR